MIEYNINIPNLLEDIKSNGDYKDEIVHEEYIPKKDAIYKLIELNSDVRQALNKIGIENLYKHQVDAIINIRNGKNIVQSLPTASGKSITYEIPIFESIIKDPKTRALYVGPYNPLINDQTKKFAQFRDALPGVEIPEIKISRYIGGMDKREKYNAYNSHIVLTNPDMIHLGFLWHRDKWLSFIEGIKYIVLDEIHQYTGIFGSHVALVVRRLDNLCRRLGASPQYICCTATIGNPENHAKSLIGKDIVVIDNDSSKHSGGYFIFWNPAMYLNDEGFNRRKSHFTESKNLFVKTLENGLQTIVFTRTRKNAEKMANIAKIDVGGIMYGEELLSDKITPFRSGYFPKENEAIWNNVSKGSIRGVTSTNAAEIGIDQGFDCCILDGYPGTKMSTMQRSGRAGRKYREGLTILVASNDALDQYHMRHPKEFFSRNYENAVINITNPYIQLHHIAFAKIETPNITEEEIRLLEAEKIMDKLDGKSYGNYLSINIRGIGQDSYTLLNENGEPIEKDIEKRIAFRDAHEGAVYLKKGISYIITKVDHKTKFIHAKEEHLGLDTDSLCNKDIFIKEKEKEKFLKSDKSIKVGLGKVNVIENIIGYHKKNKFGIVLGTYPLKMPEIELDTIGLWIELPNKLKDLIKEYCPEDDAFAGGIHAIEHAMIAMFPLNILADRNDVGGISTEIHDDLNDNSGIFIYDGHQGGAGFAEKGYEIISKLLLDTYNVINDCSCKYIEGCPSCIQSPKCGSGNKPLNRNAAIIILSDLLDKSKKE